MMDLQFLEAIILGVVQGITEFLPISSDGHLVVVQALLKAAGLAQTTGRDHLHFDVILHIGTLLAILLVFHRDLLAMLSHPRRIVLVVLASIPAAVIGLTVKKQIEEAFQSPLMAGVGFLVTALVLFLGPRAGLVLARLNRPEKSLDQIGWGDALLIGGAQALAILPGVSRSGSTISTGVLLGLSREVAATFSFLMAVPVVGGAVLLITKDLLKGEGQLGRLDVAIVGTIVSFVVGVVALRWLLKILSRGGLLGFSIYCVLAGLATITWQLLLPA